MRSISAFRHHGSKYGRPGFLCVLVFFFLGGQGVSASSPAVTHRIPLHQALAPFSVLLGCPITLDPACADYEVLAEKPAGSIRRHVVFQLISLCGRNALTARIKAQWDRYDEIYVMPNKRVTRGFCPRVSAAMKLRSISPLAIEALLDPIVKPQFGVPVLGSRPESSLYMECDDSRVRDEFVVVVRAVDFLVGRMLPSPLSGILNAAK